MDDLLWKIRQHFIERYAEEPLLFSSPARINLIGEHTDYNEGFVLPGAVNRHIYFAILPRPDRVGELVAFNLAETHTFHLDVLQKSDKSWPNYLIGVVSAYQRAGYHPGGFNCVFGGDIPIGAGLSSSAALEAGLAFALNQIHKMDLHPLELVKIAQRAENDFVGVQCGIMDQMANIFGKQDHLLKLDCRSLDFDYVPFPSQQVSIFLCDSQISRHLADSEYNLRRSQCEAGVAILKKFYPTVQSLRDVSLQMLDEHKQDMDSVIYRRCRFVLNENKRVQHSVEDLLAGDLQSLGKRMLDSHAALRDEYEVSCDTLDALVEYAMRTKVVFGARMMGAGFGGCTINLVQRENEGPFLRQIQEFYETRLKKPSKIYHVEIENGTYQIVGQTGESIAP